ncbi:MAG: FAD-linked oxidase C-terminal domain-containing protein [Vicinamibacterales bacterium]
MSVGGVVVPGDVLRDLQAIVGPQRVLTAKAALTSYESDALTAFRGTPRAVVVVDSADEVVETVRACHRWRVPFVARGSGTSLSGGSLPIADGIVIALNRLNRVLEFWPADRLAVVEPGVINARISDHAAPAGLYYAPDPSSGAVCTIGGNVAFNSGGAHCLKYGMTANHVVGLRVVLPDGSVETIGGPSHESVGADLVGLFVGSEGLFGIALAITVRLLPRPDRFRTFLAAYGSLRAAGDAVGRIVQSGLLPGAMEIMDRLAIEAAEAAVHAGYPDAAAILIVELEGPMEEVEVEERVLKGVLDASGAVEVRVAETEAERQRIWKGRKGAFSAVGRLSPDYLVQDGVVPRTSLGLALEEVERLGREAGLRVANVFHAGDGNLHPLILYDGREPGALERAEDLAASILRMCIRLGGSITGEHGVAVEKRAFLPEMFGDEDMRVMRALRDAVDERHLANRGKMLATTTS